MLKDIYRPDDSHNPIYIVAVGGDIDKEVEVLDRYMNVLNTESIYHLATSSTDSLELPTEPTGLFLAQSNDGYDPPMPAGYIYVTKHKLPAITLSRGSVAVAKGIFPGVAENVSAALAHSALSYYVEGNKPLNIEPRLDLPLNELKAEYDTVSSLMTELARRRPWLNRAEHKLLLPPATSKK